MAPNGRTARLVVLKNAVTPIIAGTSASINTSSKLLEIPNLEDVGYRFAAHRVSLGLKLPRNNADGEIVFDASVH